MIRRKILSLVLAAVMTFGVVSFLPERVLESVNSTVIADTTEEVSLPSYMVEIARMVNEQRAAAGVPPLQVSPELCSVAVLRSEEITSVFSHSRPDGRPCSSAVSDAGIDSSYCGENIAYGYRSTGEVMSGWMNSSGHRTNILNPNYLYIGVGMVSVNGRKYWTQIFTRSNNITGYDPASILTGEEAFINRLYTVALERARDPEGARYWLDRLHSGNTTGADLARGFLYSPEFLGRGTSNEVFVETLYRTFFNRASDPAGKAEWVSLLNGGASRQSVIEGFINSVEWYQLCNSYGIPSGSAAAPR